MKTGFSLLGKNLQGKPCSGPVLASTGLQCILQNPDENWSASYKSWTDAIPYSGLNVKTEIQILKVIYLVCSM